MKKNDCNFVQLEESNVMYAKNPVFSFQNAVWLEHEFRKKVNSRLPSLCYIHGGCGYIFIFFVLFGRKRNCYPMKSTILAVQRVKEICYMTRSSFVNSYI
jgi:hypothetical protein